MFGYFFYKILGFEIFFFFFNRKHLHCTSSFQEIPSRKLANKTIFRDCQATQGTGKGENYTCTFCHCLVKHLFALSVR